MSKQNEPQDTPPSADFKQLPEESQRAAASGVTQDTSQSADFERLAEEKPPGLLAEFWDFLVHNKSWWLTPIILVLLLVGLAIVFGGTAVAPFIYPGL